MAKKEKENVLLSLRKSRKAFIPEYACAILLFAFGLFIITSKTNVHIIFRTIIFGFAGVTLGYAEISRVFERYSLTGKKLIIVNGILQQVRQNVYWQPLAFVPDIHTKQTRFQRLFDFGTIRLMGSSDENSFAIRDVNGPHKIVKMIEGLIQQGREEHEDGKKHSKKQDD